MTVRYRRSPAATERRVGKSLFVANPALGSVYRMNETVGALWHLLKDPVTLDEAVAVFRAAFPDLPAERIADDVWTIFRDLIEEDLVEAVE